MLFYLYHIDNITYLYHFDKEKATKK